MIIFYSKRFNKDFISLPTEIKRIFKRQEKLFVEGWSDPRLHVKKIFGSNLFSFRITRHYRVLFEFSDEKSVFFVSIGHRKDIYK